MVYPVIKNADTGDGIEFPLPRIRKYIHLMKQYEAVIQPYDNQKSLPLVKISKLLFSKFDDIDIFFVSRKKLRIKSSNRHTINDLVSDEEIRGTYKIFIPLELCETKAVVQIPADAEFTEQYIFDNIKVKHFPEYGLLRETVELGEVKRFTIPDGENKRKDIDLVMISFTGCMLPSHVTLNRIIFPVKPFIEQITQCRKCWRHGHSEKVCRRSKGVCYRCGSSHEGNCDAVPVCVNCGKFHDAKYGGCEVKINLRKEARDKAYERVPKRNEFENPVTHNPFTLNMDEFPLLSSKRKKIEVKKHKNRKRKNFEKPTDITPTDVSITNNLPVETQQCEDSDLEIPLEPVISPVGDDIQVIEPSEVNPQPSTTTRFDQQNPINDDSNTYDTQTTDNLTMSGSFHEFESFQQTMQFNFANRGPIVPDDDENFTN